MNDLSFIKKNLSNFVATSNIPNKAQLEIVSQMGRERTIGWADGRPSLLTASLSEGICLRVLEEGGQGMVTAKGVASEKALTLVPKALEIARSSSKDIHRAFSTPASKYPDFIDVDDGGFQSPSDDIQRQLAELEKKALAFDGRLKKIIKMNYSENYDEFGLANSNGVSIAMGGSSFGFVVEILAEDKGNSEVGWDYQVHRFGKNLDMERIVFSVVHDTLESLGGVPIPSGSYPVVFHPRVGTQLLGLVTEALSAEAVQLGRSFWRNGPGSTVASSFVYLVDDPLLKGGLASGPCDDEGVPHEKLDMVKEGRLMDYFYDIRSAKRANRTSNGRGMKNALGALPKPDATNFYMTPGLISQDNLLSSQNKVFFIKDVMGLHMADPITGEFSLGASGALYENGKFSKPVRGVTVAGTVGDVLKKVISVADNLTWYGSLGCPSFLVDHLTIAGT